MKSSLRSAERERLQVWLFAVQSDLKAKSGKVCRVAFCRLANHSIRLTNNHSLLVHELRNCRQFPKDKSEASNLLAVNPAEIASRPVRDLSDGLAVRLEKTVRAFRFGSH